MTEAPAHTAALALGYELATASSTSQVCAPNRPAPTDTTTAAAPAATTARAAEPRPPSATGAATSRPCSCCAAPSPHTEGANP
jgi:hypothetical protein